MIGHASAARSLARPMRWVNRRVLSSLAHKFQTPDCVGDTHMSCNTGVSADVLRQQLKTALHGVSAGQLEKVWLHYEPVCGHRRGRPPAEPNLANEMARRPAPGARDLYPGRDQTVPILYGAALDLENIERSDGAAEMDGLFVGPRRPGKAGRFNQIVRKTLVCSSLSSGLIEIFIAWPAIHALEGRFDCPRGISPESSRRYRSARCSPGCRPPRNPRRIADGCCRA